MKITRKKIIELIGILGLTLGISFYALSYSFADSEITGNVVSSNPTTTGTLNTIVTPEMTKTDMNLNTTSGIQISNLPESDFYSKSVNLNNLDARDLQDVRELNNNNFENSRIQTYPVENGIRVVFPQDDWGMSMRTKCVNNICTFTTEPLDYTQVNNMHLKIKNDAERMQRHFDEMFKQDENFFRDINLEN